MLSTVDSSNSGAIKSLFLEGTWQGTIFVSMVPPWWLS